MKDDVALLATVTLLGVLLQAYFSLQVISARRAFHVSPPLTSGPPEFERVFRAQRRSPVRIVLPVRAPPLLPGICTLRAAQTDPGAPADGLRRRTSLSAQLEKSLEQNAGVPAPGSQFLIKVPTTVPPTFSGWEKVAYQGLQTLEGPSRLRLQPGFGRRHGPAWI
ncbi:leukotriene C4 synthase isoform X2 [Mesocricetus auratus]|uniref:Leukotriene C4 synthase isoform X2 n=1 Tax=Mesocricetus auratus TaxID=10036 RepID=A0ABM2XP01_MESAU|nr:leukotriene C4 synthase isoform X2 [Mesocricetus auratus]